MSIYRLLHHWAPPLIWCAIIFVQSAFATPSVVPHWPYFDKVLHVGVYALLSLLFYRALNSLSGLQGHRVKIMILSTLLTALYGLSDEWHQSFVPERSTEVADFAADFIGGALGSIFYGWIVPLTLRRFKKSSSTSN